MAAGAGAPELPKLHWWERRALGMLQSAAWRQLAMGVVQRQRAREARPCEADAAAASTASTAASTATAAATAATSAVAATIAGKLHRMGVCVSSVFRLCELRGFVNIRRAFFLWVNNSKSTTTICWVPSYRPSYRVITYFA